MKHYLLFQNHYLFDFISDFGPAFAQSAADTFFVEEMSIFANFDKEIAISAFFCKEIVEIFTIS